ncbi:MAG: sigma-70 family RNA polymerase sigma factor [Pseudomonadota bacterium]
MPADPSADPADVEGWLTRHGDALFRFALLQVRNEDVARDLVQETLLAAWKGRAGYQGRSSEKTWLTAILKNKVADHFRARAREVPLDDHADPDPVETADDEWADDGHFAIAPGAWHDPEGSLAQSRFWTVVEQCLDGLPEAQRAAFVLREVHGEDTDAICKQLDVTASNVWVLLHRARHRLRACLEQRWFQ